MDIAKSRLSIKNRRVSFNDKASIRVFERDESDKEFRKKTNDAVETQPFPAAMGEPKSPRKILSVGAADKENIFVQPLVCNRQVETARTHEVNGSAFYTTLDFIEKTQSSELHIENTADFTLLSVEMSPKRHPLNAANKSIALDHTDREATLCRTFYVQETELYTRQSRNNIIKGENQFQDNKCIASVEQPMMTCESIEKLPSHNCTVVMEETLNDIHSPIIQDVELSSPLVPIEYVGNSNRKLNLRQLNDDLEHGKIQIYPGMAKTPQTVTTKRKCVQNLFDGRAMSFCSTQGEKSLAMAHNEPTVRTNAKKDIRFSEADDILLNNTSYLTKAVLGDETIAGNVSKVYVENKTSNVMQKSNLMEMNTISRSPHDVTKSIGCAAEQLRNKSPDNYMSIEMDYETTPQERNKEFKREIPAASFSPGKVKPRNTLHFDEAIGVENPEENKEIKMDLHTESNPSTCSGILKPRNTLHFNEAIGVENPEGNNELEMKTTAACNPSLSPGALKRRNTLHFNEAIGVESPDENKELIMDIPTATTPSACFGMLKRRNTFHFNEAIGVENPDGNYELQMKTSAKCNPSLSPGIIKRRNTLHFNEAIAVESTDENKELDHSATEKRRSIIHFDEANEEIANIDKDTKKLDYKLRQGCDFQTSSENFTTRIDNMSFDNEMSLSIDGDTSVNDKQTNQKVCEPKLANLNSNTSPTIRKRLTMHLNESIRDECDTNLPTNDLNLDMKCSHAQKTDGSGLGLGLGTRLPTSTNAQRNTLYFASDDDIYTSPTVATFPHRSLIEFEQLESEVKLAQQRSEQKKRKSLRRTDDITLNLSGVTPLDNAKNTSVMFSSPIVREDTHKRLTVNLTPNLPMAKKRQTLIFNETISNCSLLEKETLAHANAENIRLCNKLDLHKVDVNCKTINPFNDENIKLESKNKNISENRGRENSNILSKSKCIDLNMVDSKKCPTNVNEQNKMSITRLTGTISTGSIMEISKLNDTLAERNEIVSPMKLSKAISIDSIMDITKMNIQADTELKEIEVISPTRNPSKIPILTSSVKKKMPTGTRCHEDSQQLDTSDAISNKTKKALPYTDVIVDFQFKDSLSGVMSMVEDNPITISDVSNHFLTVRHSQAQPGKSITAVEPTNRKYIDIQRETSPLLLCEQNTIHNLTNFKNKYINLTYDKNMLDSDDIDKTCLSLVGTLLDDEGVSDDEQNRQKELPRNEQNSNDLIPFKLANSFNVKNKSLCLKCKRCQDTINNDTTIGVDTFALPKVVSPPDVGLSKLRRLRSRLTLADLELNIDSLSFNKTLDSTNSSEISFYDHDAENKKEGGDREDNADIIILNYKNDLKEFKLGLIQSQKQTTPSVRHSFVKHLEILFRGLSGWIFDYQMQYKQILLFQFKRIKTFEIFISYEEDDEMGYTIKIRTIQCCRSSFPEKNWKPMDYLLDFQMKLDLPIELKTWCHNNTAEDVFKMFERIDKICKDVYLMGIQMWRIVCSEQASLLREGKRIVIRKILRKMARNVDVRYNSIEKTEFQIEVMNLRKICYKDIVFPSLHLFHEELQLLPQGLEFLQIFLKSPDQHLKGNSF